MSFPPKENFLDETLAVKYPGSRTIGKLVPKQCNVGYFLLLLLLLSLLFVSCQHLCKWYHSSIQIYNYIRHKSTNINSNLELECNVVAMRPVSWLLCPALQDKYSAAVHCAEHGMEARVKDVIDWTEEHMDTSVRDWVLEKGGWEAFMDHYDDQSWTVEIPQFLVGAGLAAAVVAGGFFLMKKFF